MWSVSGALLAFVFECQCYEGVEAWCYPCKCMSFALMLCTSSDDNLVKRCYFWPARRRRSCSMAARHSSMAVINGQDDLTCMTAAMPRCSKPCDDHDSELPICTRSSTDMAGVACSSIKGIILAAEACTASELSQINNKNERGVQDASPCQPGMQ